MNLVYYWTVYVCIDYNIPRSFQNYVKKHGLSIYDCMYDINIYILLTFWNISNASSISVNDGAHPQSMKKAFKSLDSISFQNSRFSNINLYSVI